MWSLGSSLGRSFLVAGLLPTIAFIVAMDYIAAPVFYDDQSLLNRNYKGIEDLNYLLISVLIAFLLLALNRAIIQFYANGPFLIRRWLLRRNRKRHQKNYTALRSRQQTFRQALFDQDGLEDAIGKLEGTYDALERHQKLQYYPSDEQFIKPTDLGNVLAKMEIYSFHRYCMDSNLYWPQLTAVIPDEYKGQIGELKTTMDFMLNTSLLAFIFGVFALIIGIWKQPIILILARQWEPSTLTILIGFASLIAAYGFYRIAVRSAHVFSKNVTCCFDLFRWDLLENYGIAKPSSLIIERQLWQTLARFIGRGELFYFPTTTTNEEQYASLQQALIHHTYYLHQLHLQTLDGDVPEYLTAQIKFEEKQITDIRNKLSPTNQKSDASTSIFREILRTALKRFVALL